MAEAERFRVFNTGVGFVCMVSPERATRARASLEASGVPIWEIGELVRGGRAVNYA